MRTGWPGATSVPPDATRLLYSRDASGQAYEPQVAFRPRVRTGVVSDVSCLRPALLTTL